MACTDNRGNRRADASSARIRPLIQNIVLLLTIGVGIQFAAHVAAAAGNGLPDVPRPSSVEGFLPIGAFMSWKRFLATGAWDPVHPAAMVIFGFVILVSVFLRNAFCGWFCPVGTLSEKLYNAGEKLFGRTLQVPGWIDIPLRGSKYALLGFFVWIIFSMNAAAIAGFQKSPYYKMADVKMLHFFLHPSITTISVLAVLVGLSMVIRHFWCRYLCPYGALTGLLASMGPTRVHRDQDACVGCGKCRSVCPKRLPVDRKSAIYTPECIGCMQCVCQCPAEGALAMKTTGINRALSPKMMGIAIVGAWIVLVYAATVSGHWKGGVSDMEFKMRLRQINSAAYEHPTTPEPFAP